MLQKSWEDLSHWSEQWNCFRRPTARACHVIYVLDAALPPTSLPLPISLFSVPFSKLALTLWITFMAGCYSRWPAHLGSERTGREHEKGKRRGAASTTVAGGRGCQRGCARVVRGDESGLIMYVMATHPARLPEYLWKRGKKRRRTLWPYAGGSSLLY